MPEEILSKDDKLKDRYKTIRKQWLEECREYHSDAERLHGIAAGPEQWSAQDRKRNKKMPFLVMNEVLPIVDAMSGGQITKRFERAYVPVDNQFSALAEVWEEVDRQIVQQAGADQEESMAFRNGPHIARIGWVSWGWNVIDQEIQVQEWPIWDVLWPAMSTRRMNLKDRSGHVFGDWWTRDQFEAKWGKKVYANVKEMRGVGGDGFWPGETRTDESSAVPWASDDESNKASIEAANRAKEGKIYVETWEEKVVETRVDIHVPVAIPGVGTPYNFDLNGKIHSVGSYAGVEVAVQSGGEALQELKNLTDKDLERLRELHMAAHNEEIREDLAISRPVNVYKMHQFAAQGKVLLGSSDIPINMFTLLPITGTPWPKPGYTQWISTTERLEDAQKWKSVFLTQLIRYVQISPKGTLIAERGFFRSRGEALNKLSSMGGFVEVEPGKLSQANPGYKIETGVNSPITGMITQLMEYYDAAFPRLVGFNPASLGQLGPDLRRISGEVVRAMQDAAMASNAILFDSFAMYRKEAGRVLLEFVKRFFEVEDVIRIVGDKAYTQDEMGNRVPLIPPKSQWDLDKYKIRIEDSTPDPDKRSTLWKILSEQGAFVLQGLMAPHPLTGRPVLLPEEVVELLPDFPVYMQERLAQRVKSDLEALASQPPEEGMPPEGGGPAEGEMVQ